MSTLYVLADDSSLNYINATLQKYYNITKVIIELEELLRTAVKCPEL